METRVANLWKMYEKYLDAGEKVAAARVLQRLNELGVRLADRPKEASDGVV